MTDKKEVELELCPFCGQTPKDIKSLKSCQCSNKQCWLSGYLVHYETWNTRTKSKLVELDKLKIKELLDKFIACAINREEIAIAICSRFGTKKVDVGRVYEIIMQQKYFVEGKGWIRVARLEEPSLALAQAIVKELKELEGEE